MYIYIFTFNLLSSRAFSVECSNSSGDSIRSLCAKTLPTTIAHTTQKNNNTWIKRERERRFFVAAAVGLFCFSDRENIACNKASNNYTLNHSMAGVVVVLSVIKSFIIQLKFLCNTDNDCVDSCDSGDDVLLFLYHVNNKSIFSTFSLVSYSRFKKKWNFLFVLFPMPYNNFCCCCCCCSCVLSSHWIDVEWSNMLRMHVQFIILI